MSATPLEDDVSEKESASIEEADSGGLLELLRELQSLDRVPRLGYAQRGVPDPESVSEHSYHVVFLVWALGPRVAQLDLARAMEIALVHDLAEVRFGDLPRPAAAYLPAGAKAEAERRAMADLLAPLGGCRAAIFEEYQTGETLEARFVAVCDKLQLILKADVYAAWGAGDVAELRAGIERFDDGGFAAVRELLEARLRRQERGA